VLSTRDVTSVMTAGVQEPAAKPPIVTQKATQP
jgi:hypothetical protein